MTTFADTVGKAVAGEGYEEFIKDEVVAFGVLRKATRTLTAAQLKALLATQPTIIAAPGPNKIIKIIAATGQYTAGDTAYTLNGQTEILIGQPNLITALAGGWSLQLSPNGGTVWGMDTTVNSFMDFTWASLPSGGISDATAQLSNQPIVATLANFGGSELTLGNGTLTIAAYHAVVDLQ